MSFCVNCGKQLPERAKYCAFCGKPTSQHDDNNCEKRRTIYEGSIHKCPNCGEALPSFSRNCPACGFEIRDANTSSTVREFALKLESIDAEQEDRTVGLLFKRTVRKQISKKNATERKIGVIQNFPIPNTIEDMLEFMILASSNLDTTIYDSSKSSLERDKQLAEAWLSKIKQIYKKATLSDGDSKDIQRITDLYSNCLKEVKLQERKGKRKTALENIVIFGWMPLLFAVIIFANIASSNSQEKAQIERLETLSAEIESSISRGEYLEAAKKVNYLYYPADSGVLVDEWSARRTAYIGQIENCTSSLIRVATA